MAKRKLQRFTEIGTFNNVKQLDEGKPFKGNWAKEFFKNENPIVLELACGKGEYSVSLARKFPEKNFIGIDYKGNRLWVGAKMAIDESLSNVGFLRIQIQNIMEYFEINEVDEIWITFPDPQIKYKRTKHRMTNADFLDRYKTILKPDGIVHLKTDSEFMHGYTLGLLHGAGHEVLYANHDVYRQEGSPAEVTEIQTYYEGQYLEKNKAITYIRFKIK